MDRAAKRSSLLCSFSGGFSTSIASLINFLNSVIKTGDKYEMAVPCLGSPLVLARKTGSDASFGFLEKRPAANSLLVVAINFPLGRWCAIMAFCKPNCLISLRSLLEKASDSIESFKPIQFALSITSKGGTPFPPSAISDSNNFIKFPANHPKLSTRIAP